MAPPLAASAIITATTHNGLKTSSTINVTIPVGKIELSLVDAEKAEVGIGETLRVQAVAYDAEGSTENVAQVFSWRISTASFSGSHAPWSLIWVNVFAAA